VHLGPAAIDVYLALAEPRKVAVIAEMAEVSYGTAYDVLTKRLGPKGLAVRTGEGRSQRWGRGIPLEEYVLDPDPGTVAKRDAVDKADRELHYMMASYGILGRIKGLPYQMLARLTRNVRQLLIVQVLDECGVPLDFVYGDGDAPVVPDWVIARLEQEIIAVSMEPPRKGSLVA
jgi:hypothetical protein